MTSSINLTEIYVVCALALMLLTVVVYSNRWRLRQKTPENRLVRGMLLFTAVCCIVDPITFAADGQAGAVYGVLVYAGNWWLYLTNLVIAPMWMLFVLTHLNVRISKPHAWLLGIFDMIGFAMLIVNFFTPVVFGVNENNVYFRGPGYMYYLIFELLIVADSIGVYITARRAGGMLKFFPVWVFIAPALLGIILQSVFYGISAIWPSIAISVSGAIAALQNETIYRDQLTGLYNRYYLDYLRQRVRRPDKVCFTAMMLDVNSFKAINDSYGHQTGDEALVRTAQILKSAVGELGSVIRYAGDEFVVLLNTQDDTVIERCKHSIHSGLEVSNAEKKTPYSLTVSLGLSKFNLRDTSVDELMNEIDRRMFEDKRAYYENRMNDRRRR